VAEKLVKRRISKPEEPSKKAHIERDVVAAQDDLFSGAEFVLEVLSHEVGNGSSCFAWGKRFFRMVNQIDPVNLERAWGRDDWVFDDLDIEFGSDRETVEHDSAKCKDAMHPGVDAASFCVDD
jgi:hypothetical protein